MALWGNDIKPKNLTDAEKKEVYASPSGWVREAGSILSGNGNTSATPEVLVAIGGLNVIVPEVVINLLLLPNYCDRSCSSY